MRDPEQTIGKLADKSKTAFISYVDKEGFPVTKAMLKPRERQGIKEFWFSTNTSSNKVKFFRENPKASIYFMDRRFFRGVSLIGTVEVLETSEAKERIWQKGDTLYYRGGVTDPDYCVLKFTAIKGRYYSNFHSEDFEI
ncbi:MAG: pyridoxamine 5'-phosphate oxidase family protein [Lachnospiraceae bacterium]|nr:pyridoxamine 5'-phosphate oxidase family protein [Lachnospiraceae bacterium]